MSDIDEGVRKIAEREKKEAGKGISMYFKRLPTLDEEGFNHLKVEILIPKKEWKNLQEAQEWKNVRDMLSMKPQTQPANKENSIIIPVITSHKEWMQLQQSGNWKKFEKRLMEGQKMLQYAQSRQ